MKNRNKMNAMYINKNTLLKCNNLKKPQLVADYKEMGNWTLDSAQIQQHPKYSRSDPWQL